MVPGTPCDQIKMQAILAAEENREFMRATETSNTCLLYRRRRTGLSRTIVAML
jgi:hypothetical protein